MAGNILPAYGGPRAFAQAKVICFASDTQVVSPCTIIIFDFYGFVNIIISQNDIYIKGNAK